MSQDLLLISGFLLLATGVCELFGWLKNRDTERERTKRHAEMMSKVQPGAVFTTKSGEEEVTVIGPCPVEPKPDPAQPAAEAEPEPLAAPSHPAPLPRPTHRGRRSRRFAERPEQPSLFD